MLGFGGANKTPHPSANDRENQFSSETNTTVESTRTKFLKTLLWLGIVIAVMTIFLNAPRFARSPIKYGAHVTCKNENTTGYNAVSLKDVVLAHNLGDPPKVTLDGTITYSLASDSFSLREGAFIVPLDLSGCEKTDLYKSSDVLVFVKGTVSVADGRSRVAVEGIHTSAPVWAQVVFNAGVFIAFVLIFWLLLAVLKGFIALIRYLVVLIGLRQPKKITIPNLPELIKARQSGLSLLVGLSAPILWAINPVLGVMYQLYGLYLGWHGLRSAKRKVALIGLALGVTGLIIMPLVLGASGMFRKTPEPNFYHSNLEDFGN